ncbi:hypothetical protein PLICRDRAFT_179700 [Plicaturopsis crispa FD-325 SS-3]|uniref:Uncharacterized protein n=1 Tax=Plicaturopsis crispa FD-325 SS-3 TaxID=944288 RepID=A0A0C9T8E0_PLICR|nr:hypothetical protein PLICRDRAFT_179700 [Plicaturopsis crispa FD-325 SS-3]
MSVHARSPVFSRGLHWHSISPRTSQSRKSGTTGANDVAEQAVGAATSASCTPEATTALHTPAQPPSLRSATSPCASAQPRPPISRPRRACSRGQRPRWHQRSSLHAAHAIRTVHACTVCASEAPPRSLSATCTLAQSPPTLCTPSPPLFALPVPSRLRCPHPMPPPSALAPSPFAPSRPRYPRLRHPCPPIRAVRAHTDVDVHRDVNPSVPRTPLLSPLAPSRLRYPHVIDVRGGAILSASSTAPLSLAAPSTPCTIHPMHATISLRASAQPPSMWFLSVSAPPRCTSPLVE